MAGEGKKIYAQLFHLYGQGACRLCGIHQHGHVVLVGKGNQLGKGQNVAQHVAAMCKNKQLYILGKQPAHFVQIHFALRCAVEVANLHLTLLLQPVQRPPHGVVLYVGGKHGIPPLQKPFQDCIDGLGNVGSKHNTARFLNAK